MKPLGRQTRRPYPGVEGHQDCAVCHEMKPPAKSREQQKVRKEIVMATPRLIKVFESVFHGQVYELNGKGYDVPELTYWCQENLDPQDIPLSKLTMSKSDEKHGSKEFKKHAKRVSVNKFPIVVVARNDGKLQIADGNHRAFKAAELGKETIEGFIVPEDQLPDSAMASEEEE